MPDDGGGDAGEQGPDHLAIEDESEKSAGRYIRRFIEVYKFDR